MNKELPPLHAQMQFPNLNLEEKQLIDVCYEHGVTTPRAWHMATGYEPSPEMLEFAALIKEQMKALPDIRLTISKPNTVTGRLSQAAQFDGPTNKVIHSYATAAQALDYTYEEYVMYAQAYSTIAVLSKAEYAALTIPDKNDQILAEHWDSNILFNQRNRTE